MKKLVFPDFIRPFFVILATSVDSLAFADF